MLQGPQHYCNYDFDAATNFSGSGTVVFSGTSNCLCLANLEGVYQAANTVVANGAVVTFNAAATVTNLVLASGGSVSFNAAAAVSNLVLEPGGIIAGPGTLTINNSFYWLGGTLGSSYDSTPGQTVIGSNAVMTVGMGVHSAVQRTIVNNGVAVFEPGATVNFGGGVMFDNMGVAMLLSTSVALPASVQQQITANGSNGPVPTSQAVPVQIIGTSGANYFRNNGSLIVGSVGGPIAGAAIIFGMRFYNFGTTWIANGTLLLEAGDSYGTWIMSDNATLTISNQLAGTQAAGTVARFFFDSGSNSKIQTSGTGSNATIIDSGATVQVYANLSVPIFELLGGTLSVPGSLTVTTRMLWIGGTVTGGATVRANGNGALNIPQNAALYVIGGQSNNGTVTLGNVYLNISGTYVFYGSAINVVIGGTTTTIQPGNNLPPITGQPSSLAALVAQLTPKLIQGFGVLNNPALQNPSTGTGMLAWLQWYLLQHNAGAVANVLTLPNLANSSLNYTMTGFSRAILAAAYRMTFGVPLTFAITTYIRGAYVGSGGRIFPSATTYVQDMLRYGMSTQIGTVPETVESILSAAAKGGVNGLASSFTNLIFLGDVEPWAPTAAEVASGYYSEWSLIGNVAGQLVLTVATMGLSNVTCTPGRLATAIRWTNRGVAALNGAHSAFGAGQAGVDIYDNGLNWSNGAQLGLNLLGLTGSIASLRRACFTGDMMVETQRGLVRWDSLRIDDQLASCDENNPHGAKEFKPILALLRTRGIIWHVHVDGKVIRTTGEHPFYVWGRGWIAAKALVKGDVLRRKDGTFAVVEEVFDTGVEETVYNCTVADYHTYFVGGEGWGFSIWAHNTCTPFQQLNQSGSSARGSLRNAMGAGAGWIAHHVIPVKLFQHPLVRDAANMGFAVNRAMNGVLLTAAQHAGGHPNYIRNVENALQAIVRRNGGVVNPAAVAEFTAFVQRLQAGLPRLARLLR